MPLVERKIEIKNDTTTMQKGKHIHRLYVRPKDVKPGDKVVQPSSDRQLAELAAKYPDEYAKLAKEKNVSAGNASQLEERAIEILQLSAKDTVKAIADMDPEKGDESLLWQICELEIDPERGGKSRATVLEALAKHGITGE
jgi:hypothetical protein